MYILRRLNVEKKVATRAEADRLKEKGFRLVAEDEGKTEEADIPGAVKPASRKKNGETGQGAAAPAT